MMVGVCAFSSRFLGSRLAPSKRRYFIPPISPAPCGDARDGYPAETMRGRPQAVDWLLIFEGQASILFAAQ